ncbi:MAG: hypothetical protein H7232_17790 [Aeromicrobium sp.]|nr:hypothetical protein [Burkholderiales bacterium]
MQLSTITRNFFRVVLVFLGLIILYVAFLWLRPDEALNPAAEAFYRVQAAPIPDEQNATLALSGITAPAGVDVIAHGKRTKKIYAETRDSKSAWEQVRMLGSHDFVYPAEVECWLDANALKGANENNCASAERLTEIIRESPHLARYKQIQNMTQFQARATFSGRPLISLNKLLGAEILLDLQQGRAEIAYQKWRANHLFLNKLSAAGGSWVITAINLVNESISFAMLDDLLRRAPMLVDSHEEELTKMLARKDIEHFNFAEIMRAEEEIVSAESIPILDAFKRPNYQTNRQYDYSQAFLRAARTEPANVARSVNAVSRAFTDLSFASIDYTNLINAVLSKLYIRGQLKTGELLSSMHANIAMQRLNMLRIQIVKAKKSDAEIDAFLQAASPELRNPFDGKPMQWDAAKRTIAASIPGEERKYTISL